MKRKIKVILSTLFTCVSAFAASIGTFAWFTSSISFETANITAKSAGAYFYDGDGSEENPYIIMHPRHLYNLAWLQDMGWFNTTTTVEGQQVVNQVYFRLHDSLKETGLDMNGMVIPPIGTQQYPFLGNFDGNDVVVSNFTISNQFTDYGANHPSNIYNFGTGDGQVNQPKIVGFFGVVGQYNGEGSYTYDTQENEVHDVGINSFTVQTKTTQSLIGLAAGYVNGTMSDVAVNNGSLKVNENETKSLSITDNLSDYTVVGHCTDNYKSQINQSTNDVYGVDIATKEFVVAEAGDGVGKGGSIGMTDMYNRILKVKTTVGSTSSLDAVKSIVYEPNQTTIKSTTVNHTVSNAGYYYSADEQIGNYVMAKGNNDDYMYLSGGHWENTDTVEYYTHYGYRIYDGNGHYLSFNTASSTLATVGTASDAVAWTFSNTSGTATISYSYNGTTYYLINNNGALGVSSSTSTTWTLTAGSNENELKITNNGYKLFYYNGSWQLATSTGEPVWRNVIVHGGNRYMTGGTSGNTPGSTTTAADSYTWEVDNNSYLYYMDGNTKMYLAIYVNKGSDSGTRDYTLTVRVINALNQSNYYYYKYTNNTIVASSVPHSYTSGCTGGSENTADHYLTYNSGWKTTTTNSGTATRGQVIVGYNTIDNYDSYLSTYVFGSSNYVDDVEGPDYRYDNTKHTSGMVYTPTDTTYFPLNVKKDGSQTDFTNYRPKDSNTGYVVAGSKFSSDFNNSNIIQNSRMRVSKYEISNISTSYSDKAFQTNNGTVKIYTLDSSYNYVKASDALYENYSSTRDKLKDMLDVDTSNVYGLHFMEEAISINSLVEARYVKLNNRVEPYRNYQLPVNSIDFNLIEKGYINFFAGMYYQNTSLGLKNNSFFSLHQIKRNSSTFAIEQIKEIEEVYADTTSIDKEVHSYVYKFTDGKYSRAFQFVDGMKKTMTLGNYVESLDEAALPTTYKDPSTNETRSCTYTSVFNTQRITNHYHHSGGGHSAGDIVNSNVEYGKSATVDGVSVATNTSIFYFEIPMNPGEFCLGSVNGGTGGYLFYLDIGANAKKLNRTKFFEHYILQEDLYEFPKGVAIKTVTVNTNIAVTDGDGACLTVKEDYKNTITVLEDNSNINVSSGFSATYIKGEYVKSGVGLKNSAVNPPSDIDVDPQRTKTEVWRLEIYDYNTANQATYKTVVTNTTKTDYNGATIGSATTYVQQYKKTSEDFELIFDNSGAHPSLEDESVCEFFNDNDGSTITAASLVVDKTQNDSKNYQLFHFDYDESGVTISDISVDLTTSRTGAALYFSGTGFVITITTATGTIEEITVDDYGRAEAKYSGIAFSQSGTYIITVTGLLINP